MHPANKGVAIIKMTEKTKIYLIGFAEAHNFISDIYSMKKIKNLRESNIKLDVVFAENIEKFLGVEKYCLNHQIETINIKSCENYFYSIIHYSVNNLDKRNLAALISEKKALKLNWLFKLDKDFDSHII